MNVLYPIREQWPINTFPAFQNKLRKRGSNSNDLKFWLCGLANMDHYRCTSIMGTLRSSHTSPLTWGGGGEAGSPGSLQPLLFLPPHRLVLFDQHLLFSRLWSLHGFSDLHLEDEPKSSNVQTWKQKTKQTKKNSPRPGGELQRRSKVVKILKIYAWTSQRITKSLYFWQKKGSCFSNITGTSSNMQSP